MQVPLTMSFEGMEPSDTVEYCVREEWKKLERFHGRLISARVVIAKPQPASDGACSVRIHMLASGGKDICVTRDPDTAGRREDVIVTIAGAFNTARRLLRDAFRKQKNRAEAPARPEHSVLMERHSH